MWFSGKTRVAQALWEQAWGQPPFWDSGTTWEVGRMRAQCYSCQKKQIGRNHFGTHLCKTEEMQREIRLLCLPHVYFHYVWTSCVPLSCCRICYFPRKRINTIFPCREAIVCWIGRDGWHVSVVAVSLCADVRMQHNAGCWSKTEF